MICGTHDEVDSYNELMVRGMRVFVFFSIFVPPRFKWNSKSRSVENTPWIPTLWVCAMDSELQGLQHSMLFFVSPMVSYDQLWCYDPCLNHREMGTLWKWCPCKSNFVLFTIATAPNGSRRGEVILIYNTRPFRIWITSIYYDMHYLYCLYCYVPIV